MWIDSRMSVFKEPRRPSYSFKYHSLWRHIDLLHYLSKTLHQQMQMQIWSTTKMQITSNCNMIFNLKWFFFFAIIEEEQGPTSSNYINVPFWGLFRCPNIRHFRAIKTYIQRCPHVLCQIKFEEFENIILTGLHTLYRYDFCFKHFFRLAIIRLLLQGASITQ